MRKLQSRFKNNIIKNIHWCQTVDWNKLNTQQIDQQLKQYRRIDIVFNLRHTNSIEENPLTVQIGDRFTLDGILFEPNEDELLKESLPTLNTLFEELLKRPQLVIQIQGHIYYSDLQQEEISDPYTCLSAKRAKRIYDYLLSKGISPHRLSYIGFENLYPLDKGPKYDRRVEIEIVNI
jgi:outer membrane protein OmpA-like peptidoglycan-associated protein